MGCRGGDWNGNPNIPWFCTILARPPALSPSPKAVEQPRASSRWDLMGETVIYCILGGMLGAWDTASALAVRAGGAMGFCANSCAVLLRCPQAVPCGQTARGGGGGWKGRGVHLPHNARHQQAGTEMIAGRGLRAFEGATHWKRMSAVCFDCHFKFLELRSVSRPGIWLGSQYMYRSQIMHRLKNNRLNPALS